MAQFKQYDPCIFLSEMKSCGGPQEGWDLVFLLAYIHSEPDRKTAYASFTAGVH